MIQRRSLKLSCSVSAALTLASIAGAANTNEIEPNDNKAGAQLVVMSCGDTITGNSTGTSTTVAGTASADYFRIRTTSTGTVTQYTLTMTSGAALPVQSMAIRGLNQTAGVPGVTDSSVQTSKTVGTTKVCTWYGTGPVGSPQDLYVAITGTAASTTDYVLTLTCTPITPTAISGTVNVGSVTVKPDAATDTAADTDFWVYTSNLTATADMGHDDLDATGVSRPLTAGTYYVAMGNYNTCNNLGSPADDTFRTALVLDFPNVLANSATGAITTLNCVVTDGSTTLTGLGSRPTAYEVPWYSFVVAPPSVPQGSGTATPNSVFIGNTTLLTVAVSPAVGPPSTGITVTGNLSSINGLASQTFYDDGTHGDVTPGDNTFSFLATATPPLSAGAVSLPFTVTDAQARTSSNSINLTLNPVTNLGTLPSGTTTPAAFDIAATGIVWFKFTVPSVSPADANWLDVWTSAPAGSDTEIGVYTSTGAFVASDDDDGDAALSALSFGQTSPTRPAIGTSAAFDGRDGVLAPGTYYLAVGTFNSTFNATNFSVTSTGPAATGAVVNLNYGLQSNPTVTGNTASVVQGQKVVITGTAVSGNNPASTGLAVTGDLSSIGGSATQTFYDDGTHGDVTLGDNIFSYSYTTAGNQTTGAFNIPLTVSDAQSRSGAGVAHVNVTAAPTGGCCIGGACSVLTAFNCAAAGGTYNGDGSNCAGALGTVYTSGDAFPLPIADVSTITSTVTVPAGSGTINNNLVIITDLTHTFVGDIHLTISNGATSVVLANGDGLGDDLSGVYRFYDAATTTWLAAAGGAATPVPAGDYIPDNALSAFNGSPLEGTWTLTVSDDANLDTGTLNNFQIAMFTPVSCGPVCGTSDFDGDGDSGTDADIEAFFACLSGNCCATCFPGGADFNGDGDTGTDLDIESFFAVLAGGTCHY